MLVSVSLTTNRMETREPRILASVGGCTGSLGVRFDSPVPIQLFTGFLVRTGFFEWKTEGERKRPFKIHLQSSAIMSVAGIWDTWRPGIPFERRSFSIMTTAANRFMREIHDRMPVILDRSAVEDWLSPEVHERKALEEILQPCPNEWLTAVEVSSLVNSAKNKTRDVLDPGARSRLAHKAAFLRIKSQDSSGRTLTSDLSGQATLGFISPISRF